MTPEQYTFSGDANTFIGAIALFATPVLLYWIFRSFWNSPYNVRVTPKQVTTEPSNETETPVS
jgi:uncharacterized membrane-anchored protein